MSDTVQLLMLWHVPEHLGGLAARLQFRKTRANRRHWWRTFDPDMPTAKDDARAVIERVKKAKIRFSWREVPRREDQHPKVGVTKPAFKPSRRVKIPRPSDPPQQPDVGVLVTLVTKETRLAQEALKLAIERRRQAEKAAAREANKRAADAVRRAKGET